MLAKYNQWANQTLIRSVAALDAEHKVHGNAAATSLPAHDCNTGIFFKSIYVTMSHIAGVDDLWFKRITLGDSSAYDYLYKSETPREEWGRLFNNDWDLMADALLTRSSRWIDYIDKDITSDDVLLSDVSFLDTAGVATKRQLAPALFHVFNHATHHRGQVHAAITIIGSQLGNRKGGSYDGPSLDLPLVGPAIFTI